MWLPLLLLVASPDEVALPPKAWGDVTAALSLHVADQGSQPGTAHVQLRFRVEGPPDLAVEGPEREDALDGWIVSPGASWVRRAGRWECTADLVQVKPGVVPLPGVRIRVRSGGSAGVIVWSDLLDEAADVAPVVELPPLPPSPWPARLLCAGLVSLGLLALAGGIVGGRRWFTRREPEPPPCTVALASIDRIGQSPADPLLLVAELDGVLRAYLESLGVPASRMTGEELRTRLRGVLGVEMLGPILAWGEQSKFAGSPVRRDEVLKMADEAKGVIRAIQGER